MSWMLRALGVGLRRYEVGNAEGMARRIDQDPPVIRIGLKFGLRGAQEMCIRDRSGASARAPSGSFR